MELLRQQTEKEQVKQILQQYGDDTLAYFHLQHNRKYFFSPSGKSFVSYKVLNKVAIVAGNPVGPEDEIRMLMQSFIHYAKSWQLKPFFVGLSDKYLALLNDLHMKILKIGEEAMLDLPSFDQDGLKKKVRRAVRHVEKLGVEIFFCNAQTLPKSFYADIYALSKKWLANKGKKEKGFVMTLGRIPNQFDKDCQFAIAIQNTKIQGFLCFTPVYTKRMLSLDICRREDNACNGLTEFLIIKSAEYFKERGVQKISLNFATFSGVTETHVSIKHKILYTTAQILKKMYKSDTLREFNEKFSPSWKNRYIAYTSKRNLPFYLLAILRAERFSA